MHYETPNKLQTDFDTGIKLQMKSNHIKKTRAALIHARQLIRPGIDVKSSLMGMESTSNLFLPSPFGMTDRERALDFKTL